MVIALDTVYSLDGRPWKGVIGRTTGGYLVYHFDTFVMNVIQVLRPDGEVVDFDSREKIILE